MTNTKIAGEGGLFSADFTTNPILPYGGVANIKDLGAGYFGMIPGDFDANGQVQNTDYNNTLPQIGWPGYLSTDYNLNGEVLGQMVYRADHPVQKGTNEWIITTTNWAQGAYFLELKEK